MDAPGPRHWQKLPQPEAKSRSGRYLPRPTLLLASAGNSPISLNDPTAHAEILVLREAAARKGNYRLPGTTLYVTLEPCIMCMGAILHARVSRLVFGALDPKTGAVQSCYTIGSDGLLNHRLEITTGILGNDCSTTSQGFFPNQKRRRKIRCETARGLRFLSMILTF